jgi:dTDP-glucose 4,6-dehydratase
VRSFIYGEDVAAGTLLVAEKGKPGDAFHLSTSLNISIADLVRMICEKMNVDFDSIVEVVGERAGKDAAYLLSSAKAHHDLGWHDKVSLDNGVDSTIAWMDKHLDSIQSQPQSYIHKP